MYHFRIYSIAQISIFLSLFYKTELQDILPKLRGYV